MGDYIDFNQQQYKKTNVLIEPVCTNYNNNNNKKKGFHPIVSQLKYYKQKMSRSSHI